MVHIFSFEAGKINYLSFNFKGYLLSSVKMDIYLIYVNFDYMLRNCNIDSLFYHSLHLITPCR